MPITLNHTTVSDCETANWTAETSAATTPNVNTDIPPKEGTQLLEFNVSTALTDAVVKSPVVTSFDIRDQEAGIWFLNPFERQDGTQLLTGGLATQVRLRLYSGANWADFNQGHLRDANGEWPGGWIHLRASGGPGAESSNSGTWGTAQVSSVDAIAVVVNADATNNGTNDTGYAIDWAKYWDKIIITGYNGGTTPWTPSDIIAASVATDEWGMVFQTENFFEIQAGLEFGVSSGLTAGAFTSDNEYLYFPQSSSDHDYQITVYPNHPVTLGVKNPQTQDTYAQNGVQFVAKLDALFPLAVPVDCRPNITIASGGVFNAYATLIRGWGTINFGSGGSGQIEFIKCDLYDNDELELRSTNLDWTDVRLHFPGTNKSDIGTIYNSPTLLEIDVFQVTDGFTVRVNTKITEYSVGDSTNDLVVLEGITVDLVNSDFDPDKIARVAV